MFGTSIALNHQVTQARNRDLLAEAERQRTINAAIAGQIRSRRARLAGVRTTVASVLLRAEADADAARELARKHAARVEADTAKQNIEQMKQSMGGPKS